MRTETAARRVRTWQWVPVLLGLLALHGPQAQAAENVYLTDVPDYEWHQACFGTATGNLIGFWDRHGLPNCYTGPTAGGVAPLDSYGTNKGIRSLWMSMAGRDGRPADMMGHEDDYYVYYESTSDDPYITHGRPEHAPDCIGDFIGMNQKKWTLMDGECDGNIDGYVYNYWDKTGARRWNYTPDTAAGEPAVDLQSGLRAFARHRGYAADTFSQYADFNPDIPVPGNGFGYNDLKAEIDAGYPVLIFLQDYPEKWRPIDGIPRANPSIHGMLATGYYIDDAGTQFVRARTSWALGDQYYRWTSASWVSWTPLPVRGVIAFHPLPRILSFEVKGEEISLHWEGPDAEVFDKIEQTARKAHWYVLEKATALNPGDFTPVAPPTTARELTVSACCPGTAFYRLRVVSSPR